MSKSQLSHHVQSTLPRLAKLTGSLPGLDASLMVVQYSSPAVIAVLMGLASLRDKYPALRLSLRQAAEKGVAGGRRLRSLAAAWARVGGSIGDARVIMRAFGLLPVLIPAIKLLHPDPIKSLIFAPIPTLQIISLLCYYPLEHLAWLATKGVVQMTPQGITRASIWSVRFWAMYVVLELVKLRHTQLGLKSRTRAMRNAKPAVSQKEAEGYELQSGTPVGAVAPAAMDEATLKKVGALKNDWADWKNAIITNAQVTTISVHATYADTSSGYAPLTIHWSAGGLWANPLYTSLFGTVAAIGQWRKQWSLTKM